jgi:hypothetical protein
LGLSGKLGHDKKVMHTWAYRAKPVRMTFFFFFQLVKYLSNTLFEMASYTLPTSAFMGIYGARKIMLNIFNLKTHVHPRPKNTLKKKTLEIFITSSLSLEHLVINQKTEKLESKKNLS